MARASARPGARLSATSLVLLLAAIGTVACVKRVETNTSTVQVDELRREDALRPATNLPESFTVATPAPTPRDCPLTLRDARLNTLLALRRSLLIPVQDSAGVAYRPFGDYSVEPPEQYGEKSGEGLRVDCSVLRAVGVVTLVVRRS